MKPTLLVLAAGMGSRYGGLKQLDGLGPNGETIMDYSVYDAIRAGFGKVVFVIREDFEADFRRLVLSKYEGKVNCQICYQAIDKVPAGNEYNAERKKPWGTNHAILMAKALINEPFAVINADDFYGSESFALLANFLNEHQNQPGKYCMAGYRVGNTLSENGSVSRGVCKVDEKGNLVDIVERTQIEEIAGQIVYKDEFSQDVVITPDTPVSMNMWGFSTDYLEYTEQGFANFLREHGNELKTEYYIPTEVNTLIKAGKATCEVIPTSAKWFGVTYADDRPQFVMKINELIRKGIYPNKLF